jgi:outer membrane receptor protein involved in Fe transport/Flp pilus assembly protein TadD
MIGTFFLVNSPPLFAQTNSPPPNGNAVMVLEMEGKVEFSRAGTRRWDVAYTNLVLDPGDQLKTGERSRALIRLSPQSMKRAEEQSIIQLPEKAGGIHKLLKGAIYYFHRDKPGKYPVQTPTGYAIVLGTEFTLEVAGDGTTRLTMLNGQVTLTNQLGQLSFRSGESGIIEPGKAPARTAVIEAMNVIQWCLYYPGILNVADLELTLAEQEALSASLVHYTSGDLLGALDRYPAGRTPGSDQEKLYYSSLLLAVGRVDQAANYLHDVVSKADASERSRRLAAALSQTIATVKQQPVPGIADARSSTELLAESYRLQARLQLEAALQAARQATIQSTNFSFAWARVAELEFGFGRNQAARKALDRSLQSAPRNAQALALQGFLLAAENRTAAAVQHFSQAIAIDGALGNAWLGRGLCRIRQGQSALGREDLLAAATLEPQRALLRSYLGKAYSHDGDNTRALKELELARQLDPADPTAWLYLALVRQQQNQINEGIRDLEKSRELNQNRSLFRSRFLLDQDQAIRGANLASLYQDAGMADVSAREAARAVSLDYANYSAHHFLANSYNALRDPRQINLRYEAPWLSEYLTANLLAPVGAGTLSPYVTQQEYARLFEHNRLGLVSSTEYRSNGDWLQTAVQHGNYGGSSYALEGVYRSEQGYRPNNDFEQLSTTLKLKQQLTAQDSLFLQATYYEASGGDLRYLYDQSQADPALRFREIQEPILLAGYHREWQPGVHTLLLGGRFEDSYRYSGGQQGTLLLQKNAAGAVVGVLPGQVTQDYRSDANIYTLELQQLFQQNRHTLTLGGRYQAGQFDTRSVQTVAANSFVNDFGVAVPPTWFDSSPQHFRPDMERATAYAYYHWNLLDPLVLIGGVTFDHLRYPDNFRYAPLTDGQQSQTRFSPKAGLVWTPWRDTVLRAAYSRSLGGVSFDQSFQLEPSQVAGFNQAWRSLIPESVAGTLSGARHETAGLALDQKFSTRTYLGLTAEWLHSQVEPQFGVFDLAAPLPVTPPFVFQSGTPLHLNYHERAVSMSVNQLLGDSFALGSRYRLSRSELDMNFSGISDAAPTSGGFRARQELEATLHQLNLYAAYNHPSGFFARFEPIWFRQSNRGYLPDIPGDNVWQFDVRAGYRFYRRHAELAVGVLNLTDRDYHLNPLSYGLELPRERTFTLSLRFNF